MTFQLKLSFLSRTRSSRWLIFHCFRFRNTPKHSERSLVAPKARSNERIPSLSLLFDRTIMERTVLLQQIIACQPSKTLLLCRWKMNRSLSSNFLRNLFTWHCSFFAFISNAAFNEETDSTPASPFMGYHQQVSAPADTSPGWVNNSWATTEWVPMMNPAIYVVSSRLVRLVMWFYRLCAVPMHRSILFRRLSCLRQILSTRLPVMTIHVRQWPLNFIGRKHRSEENLVLDRDSFRNAVGYLD